MEKLETPEPTKKLRRLPGQLVAADPNAAWAIWQDGEEYVVDVTRGPTGRPLQKPVIARLQAAWSEADLDVAKYVIQSLSARQPTLIPLILSQKTLFKVARHLRRGGTSSPGSMIVYADILSRVFRWLRRPPDDVAAWLLNDDGSPDHRRLKTFKEQLEDYVGTLQARDLAPKTIHLRCSTVKTWLKVNDLPTPHVETPKVRIIHQDRAPTPEELLRLLEIADIRNKVIICCMALGGFREHTLAKLCYRHVRHDLERGLVPLHIHVEAEITKGKYADYDTFLGQEAVDYLRLYMEYRRRGSPSGKVPPEVIDDDSPLIRDSRLGSRHGRRKLLTPKDAKPILPKSLHDIVYDLYVKAGFIEKGSRRHELRPHSLRKYFRTQLTALGVPTDYVEYMMGHKISTYNTVKTKGVGFLRGIYAASGLSIRPKTRTSRLDLLKEIIRSFGYNPDRVLVKEAMSTPRRTVIAPTNLEDDAVQLLRGLLKDLVKRELS